MKIHFEFNFWLWLCRFAYKKMKESVNPLPVGIPGMRDPENKCAGYTPRKWRMGDAQPDCESDGHYLCNECAFKNKGESVNEEITDAGYFSDN
jgi:hypothetical protein